MKPSGKEKSQMVSRLQLVECPRDAMQGWKRQIPTRDKIEYLNLLRRVGFHTLDCGSFVSPKAIPQMADTAEVIAGLAPSSTKLLVIVANTRGAEEAVLQPAVDYLGFPFSLSPTFQMLNTNATMEEGFIRLKRIKSIAEEGGKEMVVYLSMGFGNPYGDTYHAGLVKEWVAKIHDLGINILSIADTVGLADAPTIKTGLMGLKTSFPGITLGAHLHSSPFELDYKLQAALDCGCTRLDGALNGFGGCPMANNPLVGNMDTGKMVSYLEKNGYQTGLDKELLLLAERKASEIFV